MRTLRNPRYALEYAGWLVLVALVYAAGAKAGLSLAFSVHQVTAIWPPTGVAIAALVLRGYRVWPGIFLGAIIANAALGEPVYTVVGIAAGNTLGPLAGYILLRRFGFDYAFGRVRDVVVFAVFASALAMCVTATNGVLQLGLAQLMPWAGATSVWALWWTGDAMGVLIVAPLILTWSDILRNGWHQGEASAGEIVVLTAGLLGLGWLDFSFTPSLSYPVYPFVVWAALRAGARITTAALAILFAIAIWGTLHGHGPFIGGTIDHRLMGLVVFMAVHALTGLVLVALTRERRTALSQQHAAERRFQVLAETLPQIVWTADAPGSIEWFNQRWYDYTGKGREDVGAWGWHDICHPDDRSRTALAWPALIAAGKPFEREMRMRRSDGIFRWFLLRAEPMRDEHARLLRWYGTFTDVDDQHRALERSARIAKTLQSAFLPESLPRHPRLRFDALYLTAGRDSMIGGDWYDAFALTDGRIVISIGDVMGHGLAAAVSAGRIRQSIVASAVDAPDPATVLTKVNRLLQLNDAIVATALVAIVDPETMTMRYASAGHPPPIVASTTESAHPLPYGSAPLGVSLAVDYRSHGLTLERDSVVLFYTDGITEFRRTIEETERALYAAIDAIVASGYVPKPADEIRRAVMGNEDPTDDAVLMLMYVDPSHAVADNLDLRKTWSFHSSHTYSAHSARHDVMQFIEAVAGSRADLFTAELILGELLANTVEHAPGLVTLEVDWRDEAPVVTIVDAGPGLDRFVTTLPVDELAEDGRGLFLVKTLARDVRVEADPGYGTKMTVTLPLTRHLGTLDEGQRRIQR